MDDIRPGYYAIIPADVRYDDRITANAKLLYGEISALIGKDGYCFASNKYFAELYGFSPETIARLVSKLEDHGYIRRELIKDKSGKVEQRRIYLSVSMPDVHPLDNLINTPQQNCQGGIDPKIKETNTSITDNKKESKKRKEDKPGTLSEDNLRQLLTDSIRAIASPGWNRDDMNRLYILLVELYNPERAVRKAHPMRTQKSIANTFGKLKKWAGSDPGLMADIVDEAIANGWQGIQPPNGGGRPPASAPAEDEVIRTWI